MDVKIEFPERKFDIKESLPQVVERIFTICKADKNFPLKSKMGNIDEQSKKIKRKIQKQIRLLKQSEELLSNITTRMTNLKTSNQELREKILESLGSEL